MLIVDPQFSYYDHFISLSTSDNDALINKVKREFVESLMFFITSYFDCRKSDALRIAKGLYYQMSWSCLHYHSPMHILAILSFAEHNNISLEPWEELAIWFHDAVYRPKAEEGYNESQSSWFMRSVLPKGLNLTDNSMVNQSFNAIQDTSLFLNLADVKEKHHKILDLDLYCFSLSWSAYLAHHKCLEMEFVDATFISVRAFKLGRIRLLAQLSERGDTIYRTNEFIQKWEYKAQSNIHRAMRDLI